MDTRDYEKFGRAVWEWATGQTPMTGEQGTWHVDIFEFEESAALMKMAQDAGLVRQVEYDPAKHSEIEDVEAGDTIWYWGEEKP